ncbi:UrcA family protein [Caulobacter sp. RHG1]|uniref:UrcA family protein n=1 Tax=Caulobacter sp. (strain RHG1) TaxID=2545762 RepID=UPI0015541585|nr:UrcA family protein [Caulobacter sp. RHG1]NQE63250.1 hypothetical protein [Caulobacter sp. RHG1]
MRKIISNIAAVATLSLAIVPVLGLTQAANAAERQTSATVSFADLDLNNPAQAAIFKARVETAGETLCRAKLRQGDLQMPLRLCVAEAHRQADRQLPAAQRNALAYASHVKAVEMAAK